METQARQHELGPQNRILHSKTLVRTCLPFSLQFSQALAIRSYTKFVMGVSQAGQAET